MANQFDEDRGSQNPGNRNGGTPGNASGRSSGRSERGFAAMNPEQQREIARKGGEAVSQDREHMAAIGRKGGEASGGGNRNKPQTGNEVGSPPREDGADSGNRNRGLGRNGDIDGNR